MGTGPRSFGRTDRTVFVTRAIARINAVVEEHYDVAFDARRSGGTELGTGDVLVLPDAIRAGLSRWTIDESFEYRGGYHATFPSPITAISPNCSRWFGP